MKVRSISRQSNGRRCYPTSAVPCARLILTLAWFAAPAPGAATTSAGTVDFSRDVQPVLAKSCFACHGPDANQRRAGLRLDVADGAARRLPSGRRAIVPRDPGASELIRRIAATDGRRMPPAGAGKRLTPQQVATLRRWVEQGARYERHWAFIPPRRPAVPVIEGWPDRSHHSLASLARDAESAEKTQRELLKKGSSQRTSASSASLAQRAVTSSPPHVRNPIDAFILARLQIKGLRPSPEADRTTLIRRVTLDLTGLPPSVDEVGAFLADTKPGAYERVVDRLLQSPHYGERWARHWLDAARYADSNGYSIDAPRSIWKYRDWVIDAMNRDLPFDQFTIEQIAGDMLPSAATEQKIATGFHRNTPINEEGGIDLEQFRVESVVDRVNTTATVFLGLTLACARCHDHKYDPFAQREYYRLYAFLNNADEPVLELAPPEEIAERDALKARIDGRNKELNEYLKSFLPELAAWERALTEEARRDLEPEVRNVLAVPAEKRTDGQQLVLLKLVKAKDPMHLQRREEISELEKQLPRFVSSLVMQERPEPRETFVQIQGDFTRKGDRVAPGTPAVLPPLTGVAKPNRLDLARWLVDARNPLTARVTMNRVWMQYFGKGLVETENDFGTQGARPSHPELLDWLATEFIARGWSLKAMHRLIVTSATYRQSSRFRADLHRIDPNNTLLGRQSRLRLDAEVIRDVALAASGLLSPKIGGPGVYPPQPEGVYGFTQVKRSWDVSGGEDRYRRGMYTFFQRSAPHPALMVFDAPDAIGACTRRNRSNTPLQALTLLNDEGFFEYSRALAARVLREAPATVAMSSDGTGSLPASQGGHPPPPLVRGGGKAGEEVAARVRQMVRLCLAREPGPRETRRLLDLLRQQQANLAAAPEEARVIAGETAPGADITELAAWTLVARVVLNLDEFITRE